MGSSSSKSAKTDLNFSEKTDENNRKKSPQKTNIEANDNFEVGKNIQGLLGGEKPDKNIPVQSKTKAAPPSRLASIFSGFSLKKDVTSQSIEKSLADFKQHLISKNVAVEVAEQIATNVVN